MFGLRVVTLCLCLSTTAAIGFYPRLTLPSVNDVRDCIKEVRPNREEIRRIQGGQLPQTQAQNCLVTCIWKKAGVMISNRLFVRGNAVKYIMKKFNLPERRLGYVRKAVTKCLRFAAKLDDVCDYGGYMYKCIMIAHRGMRSQPRPKMKRKPYKKRIK